MIEKSDNALILQLFIIIKKILIRIMENSWRYFFVKDMINQHKIDDKGVMS